MDIKKKKVHVDGKEIEYTIGGFNKGFEKQEVEVLSQTKKSQKMVIQADAEYESLEDIADDLFNIEDIKILNNEIDYQEVLKNENLLNFHELNKIDPEDEHKELEKYFNLKEINTEKSFIESVEAQHTNANTYLEFHQDNNADVVKLFERNYLIWQFNPKQWKEYYDNNAPSYKSNTQFFDNNGLRNFITVKTYYWKRCWRRVYNKRKGINNMPNIHGQRTLFLFMGTAAPVTGFLELFNFFHSVKKMNEIYGDRIFLFTYPTLFKTIPENVKELKHIFEQINYASSTIDILGTSRGGLVARMLYAQMPNSFGNIRNIVTINSPNLGTPLANFREALIKLIQRNLYRRLDPLNKLLLLIIRQAEYHLPGIMSMNPQGNLLTTLNERYNILQNNFTNTHCLGTYAQPNPLVHDIFNRKFHDNIVPFLSMFGEYYADSTYGYNGPMLTNVKTRFGIPAHRFGQAHSDQFKNLEIHREIFKILEANPAGVI